MVWRMGVRSPRGALGAAVLASLLWPAVGVADHVGINPFVAAKRTTLSQTDANVEISFNIECTGANPSAAVYGGRLDLIDVETDVETYVGDIFGASGTSNLLVERLDRDRQMRVRLSRAYCYEQIDGVFHGSGMVEVSGNVVVIPAKDGQGGGGGGGSGGGGGGGSGGGDPDDPIRPGGCANELVGSGGPDVLEGQTGGDLILALGGNDLLRGRDGDDCLVGGSGRDRLLGEEGYDRLTGGGGDDRLDGGPGRNGYDAGPGDDRIKARNGFRETVRCGPGEDTVQADGDDRLRGCEHV